MKVIEKQDCIVVASYPYKAAWFCLFVVFATLYATMTLQTNTAVAIIGFLVPTVFLVAMDYKLTFFDSESKQILLNQFSILGKKKCMISFDDIEEVIVDEGKIYYGNSSVVCLKTHGNNLVITALTDSNKNQQLSLIHKITRLLKKNEQASREFKV
ncbi:hypothetical protein ACFSJY_00695 [Thalassotalea euphylliae]|uniref:hypothetical protein n=1 Tax=Thalassotalea euphylliae TaxID=1655234 RepID=UPI0036414B8D